MCVSCVCFFLSFFLGMAERNRRGAVLDSAPPASCAPLGRPGGADKVTGERGHVPPQQAQDAQAKACDPPCPS